MSVYDLTDKEVALRLAKAMRDWRVSPRGASMSQTDLAMKSGVGLTPLKRFEKTGGITLRNLVALLRATELLDRLDALVPSPETPSPLELLETDRARPQPRKRAPRKSRQLAGHLSATEQKRSGNG